MTQPPDEPPQHPGHGRPQPGPHPEQPRQPVQLGAGARGALRPWPRTGPAVAAAGAALMLVGTFVWSAGYLLAGFFGAYTVLDVAGTPVPSNRRYLGFGLFLALTLVGYLVVIARRRGVLATAGTVLAAAGLPLALSFVTFVFETGVNDDVVYVVSIVVWLATYLFVPGTRGRAVFLTAAIVGIPTYIASKIIGDIRFSGFFAFGSGAGNDSDLSASDVTGAGTVLLVFGVAYYLLAVRFDRRQRPGVAVAYVIAGFVGTASGLAVLTRDLHAIGLGVLLVVLGIALAGYGGWAGRRFTTWVWAAAVAGGVVAILVGVIDDSFVGIGVAALVIGALVVVAAVAISAARREPSDLPAEVEARTPPG